MKASALIERLAHIIATSGDIEVCVEDERGTDINIDIVYAERCDERDVALLNAYYNPNVDDEP